MDYITTNAIMQVFFLVLIGLNYFCVKYHTIIDDM